jgi:RNA polymerase sigma-32 factor
MARRKRDDDEGEAEHEPEAEVERDADGAAAESGDEGDADAAGSDDADIDEDLLSAAGAVIDVGDGDETASDVDLDAIIPKAKASKERSRSLVRHDPLTAYMQETRRYPLLSREDEHELAKKLFEAGDPTAARRLIEANLRLVVKIAYEYRRAHRNLLDLIQEGNIGLMQAVKKYDPYRGVKLSSYAAWWIRAYILKFILNNWRLVKIGTTQAQRKLFFNLRKEKERLEQLGFAPTSALLAENLDVSEKDVVEMEKRLSAPDSSLDAPMSADDDGSRTRMDFIASPEARPDQQVASSEFTQMLRGKLETFSNTLEGREKTIFQERWLTETPLTLQEIGDRYGVSRERARQLEKRMLTRLRKYLEAELGTAVDIDALSRD